MNAAQMATRVERILPGATPHEVARAVVLLFNHAPTADTLDDAALLSTWRDLTLKLRAAAEQSAAAVRDIERLAGRDPANLTAEDFQLMARAMRTQRHLITLYGPRC